MTYKMLLEANPDDQYQTIVFKLKNQIASIFDM